MKNMKSKKQKEQYGLLINGNLYEVGEIMDCPVEGQEGTLVGVNPDENSFSFYADEEGYTHPIPEGVEIVKINA